jgi:hypothetical protein
LGAAIGSKKAFCFLQVEREDRRGETGTDGIVVFQRGVEIGIFHSEPITSPQLLAGTIFQAERLGRSSVFTFAGSVRRHPVKPASAAPA